MPKALDAGTYTVSISTDGSNYITYTGTIKVLACPDGRTCT
jgi:hypothetical protein